MFSVVLATRSGATEFSGPLRLLRDMRDKMNNPANFEVIIRGDDDDDKLPEFKKAIEQEKFDFRVLVISGSRSRGYDDLHKFYNECFVHLSSKTDFIFSLPEDVSIQVDYWDRFLINEYQKAKETFGHPVFSMHQSLLPGACNYDACLEDPDSFPIYSKEWICAAGGFSHTGANDSWVQAIHHFLIYDYGLMVRHFLPKWIFLRNHDSLDGAASSRWANSRLRNHEIMRSKRGINIIKNQARALYNLICYYKNTKNVNIIKEDVIACAHNPSAIEYVNFLCDQNSPGAILYKAYFAHINGTDYQFIDAEVEKLLKLYQLIMRLRTVVPDCNPYLQDIYQVVDGKTENLNKGFGGFIAVKPKDAIGYAKKREELMKEISKMVQNPELQKMILERQNFDKQIMKSVVKAYGYKKVTKILFDSLKDKFVKKRRK